MHGVALLTAILGLLRLVLYKSPMIDSNVFAAGNQAKKLGCCQCVIPMKQREAIRTVMFTTEKCEGVVPGMTSLWKSLEMTLKSSPRSGACADKER